MYGKCRGGPWDGRMLMHSEPAYRVAIEKEGHKRPIVGMQFTKENCDVFDWGAYQFEKGEWQWRR